MCGKLGSIERRVVPRQKNENGTLVIRKLSKRHIERQTPRKFLEAFVGHLPPGRAPTPGRDINGGSMAVLACGSEKDLDQQRVVGVVHRGAGLTSIHGNGQAG